MNSPRALEGSESVAAAAPRPRWPSVVGTIGILLGILIIYDTVSELFVQLTWTAADWERILPGNTFDVWRDTLPSLGWAVFSGVVDLLLGAWLIVAALALRRRKSAGVSLCRAWAWLSIGWAVASISWAAVWLWRYYESIPGVDAAGWGPPIFGLTVAATLMVAFPVFLLVWFSRADVRTEYGSWTS